MSRSRRGDGWSLVEVLVALCLVGGVGVVASGAARSMTRFAEAARSEALGLAAASEKIEELMATARSRRSSGSDEVGADTLAVTRIWRVRQGDPSPGLDRIEVTVRWLHPSATLLTLVAVAP